MVKAVVDYFVTIAKLHLIINKKSPRGIRTSPDLCSGRHDEYLFGLAKTGGLGQVTTKKNNE